MTRSGTTLGIAATWWLLTLSPCLVAAQPADPVGAQPTPVPGSAQAGQAAPGAMAISEIPGRLLQTAALIRRATSDAQPVSRIVDIEQRLPAFQDGTRVLLGANRDALKSSLSVGSLLELRDGWGIVRGKLAGWQDILGQRSGALQRDLDALNAEAVTWKAVQETAASQQLPADVQSQIRRATEAIRATQEAVLIRRNAVLKLQADVSALSIEADEMAESIDAELEKGRERLFSLDAPPIWRDVPASRADGFNMARLWSSQSSIEVFRYYALSVVEFIGVEVLLFVAALVTVWLVRRRGAALRADADEAVRRLGFAIGRPVSTAVLLTVVIAALAMPNAPSYLIDLGWLFLLVPVVRLLPGLSARGLTPFLWALVGLNVADVALELVSSPLMTRLLSIALALAAAGVLIAYGRRIRSIGSGSRWRRVASVGALSGTVLLGAAVIAQVVGATDLSDQITGAVLSSATAAAGVYGLLTLLRGALQVALRSRLGGSRWDVPGDLTRTLASGLTWVAVVLYGTLLLRAFQLWDLLLSWATRALRYEVAIGAIGFTVGSAFSFVAVVLVAVLASRVVRFILAVVMHGHIDIQRGTAEALSKLAHYTILLTGFLLAVGASGMDLNRVTVLAGALGVGAGLGLQSVVTNFVSGLILLFERPFHVGDTITVGDMSGEVRDIGIRSSVIATWDGADALIPNASLTTGSVINWTLTDNRRRGEVTVGVAYGTDPARMLQLLRETALANPLVLREPDPLPLFVGFGDSSLDFSLRFWTLLEHSISVTSQIRVALCERLAAEGIEIPFPQQDVRVREVPGSPAPLAVATGLRGEAT